MKETYAATVLAQKADRQRRNTGNYTWRSKLDCELSNREALKRAFIRPTKLTLQSPINLFIAVASAFINGLLFLLVATFPLILIEEYGFSSRGVGLAFEGIGIGNVVGLAIFACTSDRYIRARLRKGLIKPEDRLPLVIASAPVLAMGFLCYGWAAEQHAHWIVPIIGTSFIGMGNIFFFSGIIGYLIDTFTAHAASAIAANIILRSLGGALLPLAGNLLYRSLGWGWGSSVLALIALSFMPGLVLLYTHGERLRQRYRWSSRASI
jgi:MFS family permease